MSNDPRYTGSCLRCPLLSALCLDEQTLAVALSSLIALVKLPRQCGETFSTFGRRWRGCYLCAAPCPPRPPHFRSCIRVRPAYTSYHPSTHPSPTLHFRVLCQRQPREHTNAGNGPFAVHLLSLVIIVNKQSRMGPGEQAVARVVYQRIHHQLFPKFEARWGGCYHKLPSLSSTSKRPTRRT